MAEDKFEQAVIEKLKGEGWWNTRRWCQDYGQAFLAPRGTALQKFFKTRISA